MKTIAALAVTAALLTTGALAQAERTPIEGSIQLHGLAPAEDNDWSSARGLEAQLRFWEDAGAGLAFVLGVQQWEAVEEFVASDMEGTTVDTAVDGETELITAGISFFARGAMSKRSSVAFEGGLRYAFAESDVTVEATLADGARTDFARDTVDVEDTFLAVVGLDLEFLLATDWLLNAGLGYQFDLLDPRERVFGEDLGKTDFSALQARFGLSMTF